MKIGIFDGSIAFARGTISRNQDRERFLASDLARDARQELVNVEWWHLTIKPEAGIVATLIYHGNRLHMVLVLMEIPADSTGEWTRELELERKRLHDEWLRRELGKPPYRYAWGVVASELDEKGVVSEIIIRYEP
jgi:hypothetical protein